MIKKKKIKIIGLGKIGFNLALKLKKNDYEVWGYDSNVKVRKKAKTKKIMTSKTLVECIKDKKQQIYLLSVPSGKPVDEVCAKLLKYAKAGSIVIDLGNSNWKLTLKRYQALKAKKIEFIDAGISGGQQAAFDGLSIMVGGVKKYVKQVEHIFKILAVENGYSHVGKPGSGHYVKMAHNGIEYGMMQALAEGCEILQNSNKFKLNMPQILKVWANGSVIRSYLVDIVLEIYLKNPKLKNLSDKVNSSGEGLWALEEALDLKIPTPVLYNSVSKRYDSKQKKSISGQLLNAMRNKFGGHKLSKK